MDERQQLLTVKEACHRLSISRPTLQKLLKRGDLKALSLIDNPKYRTLRFEPEEIERYLAWLRDAGERKEAVKKSRKKPSCKGMLVQRY